MAERRTVDAVVEGSSPFTHPDRTGRIAGPFLYRLPVQYHHDNPALEGMGAFPEIV